MEKDTEKTVSQRNSGCRIDKTQNKFDAVRRFQNPDTTSA